MGVDEGFDMVPRLSRGSVDADNWSCFIAAIKLHFKEDPLVEMMPNYIVFKAGEHPRLPFEGHKFLRFSSKICGPADVCSYISTVMAFAKAYFGPRVQFWTEAADQMGYYGWGEVNESLRSYEEPDENDTPQNTNQCHTATGPTLLVENDPPLFEVTNIPGKGKGLVARVDIPKGTRVLCEKPLLTFRSMSPKELEPILAVKLKAMTRTEQRQFFSLHNNFPGKYVLSGIVKTNALPCGPGSSIGGVYATICLINHSCVPNSHNNWNDDARHETIHAIRPVKAGEEITVSYDKGGPSTARRAFLKEAFGFDCGCSTCKLPPSELRDSDARRLLLQRLDDAVGDRSRMATRPADSLRDCRSLLRALAEEFGGHPGAHACRLYCDAFRICVAHGDQARASVFAGRAHEARVSCEGGDSPEALRVKSLSLRPTDHLRYGLCSMKWKSRTSMVPKGLDEAQFEAWLFREKC
ncbi:hypothetical protein diail_8429 [Diaporthe ilicicola]|nr:hypothetical protein diail_8429 [Diaporthe ilicicola]